MGQKRNNQSVFLSLLLPQRSLRASDLLQGGDSRPPAHLLSAPDVAEMTLPPPNRTSPPALGPAQITLCHPIFSPASPGLAYPLLRQVETRGSLGWGEAGVVGTQVLEGHGPDGEGLWPRGS